VLEVPAAAAAAVMAELKAKGIACVQIGTLNSSGVLTDTAAGLSAIVGDLAAAWRKPLDW
jgi:hypothetical protein